MRLTVSTKITAGIAAIVLFGVVAMLVIYRSLNVVDRNVQSLARVEQPLILAAYEMEINMNGIGLEVLKYLSTRNRRYRDLAIKDFGDFDEFHASWRKLITSDEEHALDAKISRLYGRFRVLGNTLMRYADEQDSFFQAAANTIEEIDSLIHENLRPTTARLGELPPSSLIKAIASARMEAEISELGFWMANYQRLRNPAFKTEIADKTAQFAEALADLESQRLNRSERRIAQLVRELFDSVNSEIAQVIAIEDRIAGTRDEFVALRVAMDGMLDDRIQPLARQHLDAPREEAEAAAADALLGVRYLIPLFLLAAILVGVLVLRLIMRPLNALRTGTGVVGRGNLDFRLALKGSDEFSDLARHFNHMVGELQATTVSKDLLEASEEKLRQTVDDLRHQINERVRAEVAREDLQAALRRSETMSAMGALVAGVAHEVRNPLFGISATLDAIQARFDDEQHEGYLEALRDQVERLNKLMGDLLEYGKPVTTAMQPAAVSEIIAQAVQSCAPLAAQAGVEVKERHASELPCVNANRDRLVQAFENVLQNAVQNSAAHTVIIIETRYDSRAIVCTVEDGGSGFAPEDLEHVFDPFFSRRRGGTGLGLSIVQRIVTDHGGTVTAANRPAGGAVVTIRLPALQIRRSA